MESMRPASSLFPLDRFDNPYIAFRTVAADSDTVCPALRTDEKLSRWTPVYGYEIDDTDAPLGPLPAYPSVVSRTVPTTGERTNRFRELGRPAA